MTFQIGDLVIINRVSIGNSFYEKRKYGLLHGEPATIISIGDLKRGQPYLVRTKYRNYHVHSITLIEEENE